MVTKNPQFKKALKASAPVAFGYFPLGAGYGLLMVGLGLHWGYATLSSLLILAGAAQYFSVGLLAAGAGFYDVLVATLAINIRHLFYGFPFLQRYDGARFFKKLYMIFGLTDETFSVLSTHRNANKKEDEDFCFYVSALNHAYWVSGTAFGAIAANFVQIPTDRIAFVLTALFAVLCVEQAYAVKRSKPFVIAAVSFGLSVLLVGKDFLLLSLATAFMIISIGHFTKSSVKKKGGIRVS